VRGEDPVNKRPIPEPEAFFIDIDICMNCGFCAEFCPFDAIKMDHDYELASYDRTQNHIFDKERLSKPFSYWKTIAPTLAAEEAEARGGWEHSDVLKERKKQEAAAAKAAAAAAAPPPTPAPKAEVARGEKAAVNEQAAGQSANNAATARAEADIASPTAEAPAAAVADADAEKAERQRKREAALARKHAKENKDQ
jgi:NADH-quinone oxidoreductase subunit I